MNNQISFQQVLNRLSEQNISYTVVELQNDARIVLCRYGGRILGPFVGDAPSWTWLNAVFNDRDEFEQFIETGQWNIGGDRLWIGPEIQYCIADRGLDGGTVREIVQPSMDPGNYSLSQYQAGQWQFDQSMRLDVFNLADGQKNLEITRIVRQTRNPLIEVERYREIMNGVSYAGYEQEITLSEDRNDDIASNVWSVVQLNPSGSILTPTFTGVTYIDYYRPVDSQVHTVLPHCAIAQITGDRQYKVGYRASSIVGRMAYLSWLENNTWQLMVRSFNNNPSAIYPDEPPHLPGGSGASVFIYNDDGEIGGFGELEFQGQPIGGPAGRSSITESSCLWFFAGAKEKIDEIIKLLLGLNPDRTPTD